MTTWIDPSASIQKLDAGVPPEPPEAHQKATRLRRTFVVGLAFCESLSTGDDHLEEAGLQYFFERFVALELEGIGFWTWGQALGQARCEVSHRERLCIEGFWNYEPEVDEDEDGDKEEGKADEEGDGDDA